MRLLSPYSFLALIPVDSCSPGTSFFGFAERYVARLATSNCWAVWPRVGPDGAGT